MQQLNLFQEIRKRNKEQINLDLFQAYFDARKNKRNTNNALAFENAYNYLGSYQLYYSKSIHFSLQ